MPKPTRVKHKVFMSQIPEIEIGNADIEFHVWRKFKKLGRLLISNGGIEWMPVNKSKNGNMVNWKTLIELIK